MSNSCFRFRRILWTLSRLVHFFYWIPRDSLEFPPKWNAILEKLFLVDPALWQLLTSITGSSIIERPFSNSTIYLNKVLVERVLESSKSQGIDDFFLFQRVLFRRREWIWDGWTWVKFCYFPMEKVLMNFNWLVI